MTLPLTMNLKYIKIYKNNMALIAACVTAETMWWRQCSVGYNRLTRELINAREGERREGDGGMQRRGGNKRSFVFCMYLDLVLGR